jgi:hypothetical protein
MSQNTSIGNVYTKHHAENRRPGFTIMETGRSEFLQKNIGTGKINPETMSQIFFENRTLHRCNYCTYKKIELKNFKAILMFDEIIS